MIQICQLTTVTQNDHEDFTALLPQLSSSAKTPSIEQFQEIADNDTLLIARDSEAGDRIVGSLTLVTFRIPTGVRSWIEDVVVETNNRGKGIGEMLTMAALEKARELGAKTVDLTSRPSREAANRLYQRVGFKLRETNLYRFDLE
ncbi:MAG TPA: GNAT family N-acetyltransferase [Bellilinea sp.]|nr:GNAT family N-acetyltransferase [Bellilinea sp.]